ncbi:MAG TPA: hypothetical protein VHV55_14670 [Pirellulales bacterium]|nr:hypothetical protein [Pirellulales bacterium]
MIGSPARLIARIGEDSLRTSSDLAANMMYSWLMALEAFWVASGNEPAPTTDPVDDVLALVQSSGANMESASVYWLRRKLNSYVNGQ